MNANRLGHFLFGALKALAATVWPVVYPAAMLHIGATEWWVWFVIGVTYPYNCKASFETLKSARDEFKEAFRKDGDE